MNALKMMLCCAAVVVMVFAQGCNDSDDRGGDGQGEGHGGKHGKWGNGQWEEKMKNLPPECQAKMKALREEMEKKRAEIDASAANDDDRKAKRGALREESKTRREEILASCKGNDASAASGASPAPAPSASANN